MELRTIYRHNRMSPAQFIDYAEAHDIAIGPQNSMLPGIMSTKDAYRLINYVLEEMWGEPPVDPSSPTEPRPYSQSLSQDIADLILPLLKGIKITDIHKVLDYTERCIMEDLYLS